MSIFSLKTDRARRNWFIFGFLVPVFLIHLLFNLVNRAFSMALAFFDWSGYSRSGTFAGLMHFRRLVNDDIVWIALKNNLYFAFWTLACTIALALFLAYAVTKTKFRENRWYEAIYFFPNTLSMVIIAMLWLFFFNPSFGPASSLFRIVGIEPPIWLGDSAWVKPSLILPQVWASTGFYFLIFVAAIKNIPPSYYEAAELDGANNFHKFFRITLPLIGSIVITTMIFNFVTSFNGGFTVVKVMTNGGPNNASEILATYLFSVGIKNLDYGYGAAIGWISIILSILFYLLLTKIVRVKSYEY